MRVIRLSIREIHMYAIYLRPPLVIMADRNPEGFPLGVVGRLGSVGLDRRPTD
jgi:hypothetical protein